MARHVGIIGYPIGHSISPIFQQAALDHCNIDARYQAWEVAPHDLGEFVQGLRSPDALGCNVTVPHKEAVMRYLDKIDDWAAVAGAVNTIVNRSGSLIGHNTDGQGFLQALEERGGLSPRGLHALVLGAGGSARAVCLALAQGGAEAITIANRTLERAEVLARQVKGHCPKVVAVTLKPESIARAAPRCDLVVNCTTLGMKHGPAQGVTPLTANQIPRGALVYDLVYNPPITPLLEEAAKVGSPTLGGLAMLVNQGAASFELWTGREAPVDVMMMEAREAIIS